MCRLSQCALGKVRKTGKCYDVLYQEWAQRAALSHKMRKMTVQMKVFHCIEIKVLNKTDAERVLNLQ